MGIGACSSRRCVASRRFWRWLRTPPRANASPRRLGGQPDRRLGLAARQGLSGSPASGASRQGLGCGGLNAGVSGDTAADGLARYDWAVPADADALIVELGANDMLRGLQAGDDEERRSPRFWTRPKPPICRPSSPACAPRPISAPSTTARSTRSIRLWPKPTTLCSIRSSSTASRATRSSTSPTACIRPPRGSRSSSKGLLPSVEEILKQVKK